MLEPIHVTTVESGARRSECIHVWFEAQAARTPGAPAIRYESAQLSYAALNTRANVLAWRLISAGVGPETLVGLYLERSLDIVVGILGILKAGGAYVPVDPGNPRHRTRFVLEDARPRIVVTDSTLRRDLPDLAFETLCVDTLDWRAPVDSGNPPCAATSANLAYVIYTSGSTGKPKGTLITHGNVVRLFRTTEPWFGFGPADVWSVFHSFAFDFSVWELWGALHCGGKAVIVPGSVARSPDAFHDLLSKEGITVLCQTPSAFYPLIDVEASGLSRPPMSLRFVIFGGEALEFRRLEPWLERHGEHPKLVNMYGITETTVHATYFAIRADALGSASVIGVPLPDLRVHLLDERRLPVQSGAVGEIYVGGPGVARGYLHRPELTAERFLPDPFSGDGEARLYKSGDLARVAADGQLEFRGRIDDQIKLRGYRIEPGEIETALNGCPGVAQSVVVSRDGLGGDKELVAYVIAEKDAVIAPAGLRSALGDVLPAYMVPSAFVRLESWLLTHNGKIDRGALPSPRREDRVEVPIAAARTNTEARVAAVWAEALGTNRVGVFDDYFDLGGHSLMATRICVRLRGAFDIPLSTADIVSAHNVATLAAIIDARIREGGSGGAVLRRQATNGVAPTSFGQDAALYFHELAPGNLAYNNQVIVRFRGNLDINILERSLAEIVSRHESLRTTFERSGGEWRQRIHPPWPVTLPLLSASTKLQSLFEHQFDPGKLPLVHWSLIRIHPHEHLLIHVEHHLIHDGWSFGVFIRELIARYGAHLDERPAQLEDLPVQFADFAIWQRTMLRGTLLDELRSYWQNALAGARPVLDLPTDRTRPTMQTFRGDEVQTDLPPGLALAMRSFASARGYSLFSLMLAGFVALLRRYTAQDDLIVGAGYANRERAEAEALIGMIVNMLPLRVKLADDPQFGDLIARVQAISRDAMTHQALPFDLVARGAGVPHDPSRHPLCQVAFSFHDAPVPSIRLPGLTGNIEYPHNGSAKFDMNVIVVPHAEQQIADAASLRDDRITIKWDFNTDLYDRATVERMVERYIRLLRSAIADSDQRISDIVLLDDAELQRLTARDGTESACPRDSTIVALFEEQAARAPDAIALEFVGAQLRYGELNRRANQLAQYLCARGVGPEVKVGICIERSVAMVVGILGILKAGGAYVPLDPDYPSARLELMLRDALAPVLLTQARLCHLFPAFDGAVVCTDESAESIARENSSNLGVNLRADNLAYVMYTSGSTGAPKGVCVEHRNVIRLVRNTNYVSLGSGEVFLQFASISFDASTFELWGCLLNGARLVVAPPGLPSLDGLARTIRQARITVLWLTAALFQQMVDVEIDTLRGVRQILAGGEALSVDHVRRMLAALPRDHRLINGYGPTESTTFACCHIMARDSVIGRSVPIGRPISHTHVYILDERRRAVPEGVPGELYIGGDGLAREYLNQPGLTAERFVIVDGQRLYRTGDRARHMIDGNLEFLGRTDDQIKLRGYRIEPGEVEAALLRHASARECVVQLGGSVASQPRLVAYVVSEERTLVQSGALRQFLRSSLPEYMVPSIYVAIDRVPLTPIGKVDHAALAAIDLQSPEAPHKRVGPRTPGETILAEIWAEHLGRDDFGVEENFFDLGGHSLIAAGIFAEINTRCGVALPLALLFERPTIATLAEALPLADRRGASRILIPVHPEGNRPPIFAMLGIGGSYVAYATLTKAMGKEQPFFSLEMPGLEDGDISGARIEDIAARFREEMRAVAIAAPCVLIGACAGALVVFELAQRLAADGVPARILIMLDPPPTGAKRSRRLSSHRLWRQLVLPRFLFGRLWLYTRGLATREMSPRQFLRDKAAVMREILVKRDLLRASRHEIKVTRVREATSAALTAYAPRPYQGRVALLLGDRFAPERIDSPVDDWRSVCRGDFEVGVVPGQDTGAMLRPPHVEILIARLKALLGDV